MKGQRGLEHPLIGRPNVSAYVSHFLPLHRQDASLNAPKQHCCCRHRPHQKPTGFPERPELTIRDQRTLANLRYKVSWPTNARREVILSTIHHVSDHHHLLLSPTFTLDAVEESKGAGGAVITPIGGLEASKGSSYHGILFSHDRP